MGISMKFQDKIEKINRTMDRVDRELGLSSSNVAELGTQEDQIANLSDRLTKITGAVGIEPEPPAQAKKSLIPRMSKMSKIPRFSSTQNASAKKRIYTRIFITFFNN